MAGRAPVGLVRRTLMRGRGERGRVIRKAMGVGGGNRTGRHERQEEDERQQADGGRPPAARRLVGPDRESRAHDCLMDDPEALVHAGRASQDAYPNADMLGGASAETSPPSATWVAVASRFPPARAGRRGAGPGIGHAAHLVLEPVLAIVRQAKDGAGLGTGGPFHEGTEPRTGPCVKRSRPRLPRINQGSRAASLSRMPRLKFG